MPSLICPFCLEMVEPGRKGDSPGGSFICSNEACGGVLPGGYVREYKRFPPIIPAVLGLPGHGKTAFFAAMFYAFRKWALDKIWDRFYTAPLDERTLRRMNEGIGKIQEGGHFSPTPTSYHVPAMIRMAGFLKYINRTVLIYDLGGETFQNASALACQAFFLKTAKLVILLISPSDMKNPPVDMHNLLNAYAIGLSKMGEKTEDRELLVVYSKGDRLPGMLKEYGDIYDYLREGDGKELSSLDKYIRRMMVVSQRLQHFTRNRLKAHLFANTAEKYFPRVDYCIISSKGMEPDSWKGSFKPSRVLDPLIWICHREA